MSVYYALKPGFCRFSLIAYLLLMFSILGFALLRLSSRAEHASHSFKDGLDAFHHSRYLDAERFLRSSLEETRHIPGQELEYAKSANNLGCILFILDRKDEGRQLMKESVAVILMHKPNDLELNQVCSLGILGQIYLEKGRIQEANSILENTIVLWPVSGHDLSPSLRLAMLDASSLRYASMKPILGSDRTALLSPWRRTTPAQRHCLEKAFATCDLAVKYQKAGFRDKARQMYSGAMQHIIEAAKIDIII